ncbi:Hpt domain-containing protein [Limibaculum sp. FT325]|uniref:Hpt domain-containing protein n=1 Tax=Thermohalobaculum sediminis TaxID=2939436 RepID=UPI0020BE85C1|nr:Hpt domain-containing protein [Limibaculum sediminis]MCL5775673.1 Hpt domain-containing protein [Limibaculum sediminis]
MFSDGAEAAMRRAGLDPDDGTLDTAVLDALGAEFGPALLADVAASFRAESAKALDALDDALARGDAAVAERQFHFIKGSALYLALGRLAGLCERLECEARAGHRHGAAIAATLRAEVSRGLDLLAALGVPSGG